MKPVFTIQAFTWRQTDTQTGGGGGLGGDGDNLGGDGGVRDRQADNLSRTQTDKLSGISGILSGISGTLSGTTVCPGRHLSGTDRQTDRQFVQNRQTDGQFVNNIIRFGIFRFLHHHR